jgi:hypothetical protein
VCAGRRNSPHGFPSEAKEPKLPSSEFGLQAWKKLFFLVANVLPKQQDDSVQHLLMLRGVLLQGLQLGDKLIDFLVLDFHAQCEFMTVWQDAPDHGP